MADSTSSKNMARRDFVKRTAAATAGVSAGLMTSGSLAYGAASDTDKIRVGLVGCGGRGTGAAVNCVDAADGVELVAMADLFHDRMQESKENLKKNVGDAFKVTNETTFLGFDAYEKLLETDINYVILATPPHFRPMQARAAVEAGKHVFMEKPVAVDPVGIRSIMETAELADRKGVAIVAGTQRRHQPHYLEFIDRIRNGAIGEVMTGSVYWNQGGLWLREKEPGMSDMEWNIRNWLYFTWVGGDHIVEQHVHNIDVANWVMGGHPTKALGVGGRQVRTDPSYGHVFDHFSVELFYPGGKRVLSMCRQQDGTPRQVVEQFTGTQGSSETSANHAEIYGPNSWKYEKPEGERSPYVLEHRDMIASIRSGDLLNEGQRVAESVLTAIMAREAAYTGQEITWDEILNAELDLGPDEYKFSSLPFPDVPKPGVTSLDRSW